MQNLIPVSVFIITFNEESHLRRLLPQLQIFAEVIIVDSGSNDQTESVARQFSNVSFCCREWQGFGRQKQYALGLCNNEWVLNLDADEELTVSYLRALTACISENEYDALQSKRRLLRWGRAPKSFHRDDVLIRLFRKSCGRYLDVKVHERIEINGRIKTTDACLLHLENLTFSQRISKSNQYSQLKAEQKYADGKQCTLLHVWLAFPVSFVSCYFLKGCFLDGMGGLLTSMNHAIYSFLKYAKLWELQRRGLQQAQSSVFLKTEAVAAQK